MGVTDAAKLERLKKESLSIPITVQIGKSGITASLIEEIAKQFKTKELVKVKLLNNFIRGKDKDEVTRTILAKTKSQLVVRRGFIIILYKPGAKKKANEKNLTDKKKQNRPKDALIHSFRLQAKKT